MTTKLICPGCQAKYAAPKDGSHASIRCPACGEVHPTSASVSRTRPKKKAASGGMTCPGCKREMAAGVNYCVACNLSLFDAWGDVEAAAESAGRSAEIRGYAELAWKTTRFFIYFVTLRWGKIFNEL